MSERPVVFGPDGEPANEGSDQQTMVSVPRQKFEELIGQLNALARQNREMAQQLQPAMAEVAHWRALDTWRFFAGHIIGGMAPNVIGHSATVREQEITAVCALAERMVEQDIKRRPQPGQYDAPVQAHESEKQPAEAAI